MYLRIRIHNCWLMFWRNLLPPISPNDGGFPYRSISNGNNLYTVWIRLKKTDCQRIHLLYHYFLTTTVDSRTKIFLLLLELNVIIANSREKKVVFYWFCNFRVYSGLVFWSELWYKYKFIIS